MTLVCKMDSFDLFKDAFREELVFLYSIETDLEVFDIAKNIFNSEGNWNNADQTTGQYVWSLDEIENFCHIIYNSEGF